MSKTYNIDQILDEIVTLPSLPTVVARVTQLVDDPDASLQEVGKVIATDPSLALKTLRLVNSAYYGLGHKVSTVEHAVVLLGEGVMKNVVFTATVFGTLQDGAGELLRHSVSCGIATRVLLESGCAAGDLMSPEEGFICGLLHDIGKIVLQEFLPDESEEVSTLVRNEHVASYEAEREIIGVDHAQIGARLAEAWKLSEELTQAIAGHHVLAECKEPSVRSLSAALAVGDYICTAAGFPSVEDGRTSITSDMWEAAGLTNTELPETLSRFFDAVPTINGLLQVAA